MTIRKRNEDPAWRNTISALDTLCQQIMSEVWNYKSVWQEVARIRDWMRQYGEEPWGHDEHEGEGNEK